MKKKKEKNLVWDSLLTALEKLIFEPIYNIPFSFDLFVCYSLWGMNLSLCFYHCLSDTEMYYKTLFSTFPYFKPLYFFEAFQYLFLSPSLFLFLSLIFFGLISMFHGLQINIYCRCKLLLLDRLMLSQ